MYIKNCQITLKCGKDVIWGVLRKMFIFAILNEVQM